MFLKKNHPSLSEPGRLTRHGSEPNHNTAMNDQSSFPSPAHLADPYVDGFVLSVPRSRIADYIAMADAAGKIWLEHGALAFRECLADDMSVQGQTPFPQMAKTRDDEVTFFSWITFASKESRDAVNAKVMADPRISEMCNGEMFIDCARMAYGGFRAVVAMEAAANA